MINSVEELLTSAQPFLAAAEEPERAFAGVIGREPLLARLEDLARLLPTLTERVIEAATAARAAHVRDVQTVTTALATAGLVTTSPKRKKEQRSRVGCTPTTTLSLPPQHSRIKFSDALSLSAVRVASFDLVKQDGDLYYIESAEQFAVRICGHLLHGNIGTIFIEDRSPEKIKDCKYSADCDSSCSYYHDPTRFPGSRDCRNYIANSWLYVPPGNHHKARTGSRRFGSRDRLDLDIVGLQAEEISRFHDQTMHDLLCSLLLRTC
jgi:hypothetical protein